MFEKKIFCEKIAYFVRFFVNKFNRQIEYMVNRLQSCISGIL